MNPIAKLQKWMDSPSGQVFMNYAYSWGAAIVILGALFKLTHIQGANLMLFIGMGTEVFVFFISGFERTYQETPETGGAVGGQTVVVSGGSPLPEGAEVAQGPIIVGGGAPVGAVPVDGVAVSGSPVVGGPIVMGSQALVPPLPIWLPLDRLLPRHSWHSVSSAEAVQVSTRTALRPPTRRPSKRLSRTMLRN